MRRPASSPVIALATGHPMGPQTAFLFGAGVTSISTWVFVAAVFPASLFRAACFAYLGAHILGPSSPWFWLVSGVLVFLSVVPLAHPGLRARLFGRVSSPARSGENEPGLNRWP